MKTTIHSSRTLWMHKTWHSRSRQKCLIRDPGAHRRPSTTRYWWMEPRVRRKATMVSNRRSKLSPLAQLSELWITIIIITYQIRSPWIRRLSAHKSSWWRRLSHSRIIIALLRQPQIIIATLQRPDASQSRAQHLCRRQDLTQIRQEAQVGRRQPDLSLSRHRAHLNRHLVANKRYQEEFYQ